MHPGYFAQHSPHKPAIHVGSTSMTYQVLDSASRRLALFLRNHNIVRGDTIAMIVPNTPNFFVVAWAAQRSGLYYLPLSTRLSPDEISYILADSGAKALIVDATVLDNARRAWEQLAPNFPSLRLIMGGNATDFASFEEVIASAQEGELDEVEGSDMLYTSGTTGKPKGVKRPLTFAPLGNDPRRVERMRSLFLMDADTIFFTPAPLYHAAPLRFCMTVFRLGGTVVLTEKFDAENALACLGTYRVTHSQWVPTMFVRLLQLPEERSRRLDLSSHRVAIHSGAPCSIALKRRMIDWWGPILHEYYSGTESVGFTHATSEEWLSHPGTVGRPWGCKIHIVGEDHQERGPGEVGTVYFESHVELRYHNDPDKTIKAHHKQGWATMGDIGYVDTDGYLYLTDRKAFTIVSGGVNIYPREIEELLESSPLVKEVCVFGVPDPEYGEAVQAVIQPTSLEQAGPELAHELFAFVRSKLAAYKCPRYLDFRDELPHMENGKLHKQQLQNEYKTRIDRGYTRSQKHKSE
ncbi:MAG: acyl-CoA synthetase [Ktedonobacteraceae bacterium]